MDEKRQAVNRGELGDDVSDGPDYSESDTQSSTEPEKTQADNPLVIVDDDDPTLQAVSDALRGFGYVVHAMVRSEDTLIKVDSLVREGEHPTILIDLIMPKMDGSGVLGGIELMDFLNNNFKNLHMIVMSDYPHAESETKVCEQGHLFMLKPRRADIRKLQMLNDFIGRLQTKIQLLGKGEGCSGYQKFNPGNGL
jgi:CheY-like chemotaxis protein